MFLAPPMAYDEVMKKIPYGKVITVGEIRNYFAKRTMQTITAGIFTSIIQKGRTNIRYYVKDYEKVMFALE